tara:strand:+ start:51021 stop:52859 length:1839 start_codon:yes stop_codon:yes gene_type:complete
MVLGMGINITDTPIFGATYWVLHGILFTSALIVLTLLGGPLLRNTYTALYEKRISVEGLFLLSILGALGGSLVATFQGTGSIYYEVVAIVLVIYTVGKNLGIYSREKAIAAAHTFRETFDYAYTQEGKIDIEKLRQNDEVIVGPGQPITVDGIITKGESFVQERALTGEPTAIVKHPGDKALAGTYTVDGTLHIQATHLKGDRVLDTIIDTVENAHIKPSHLQEQADRIMQWFLPAVITISLGTFCTWLTIGHWSEALFNSMAVLIIACPCALGLATPIAVYSGLLKLSKLGLISKNGDFLDTLAQAQRVVFDKTGTLSEEELVLVDWVMDPSCPLPREELKAMAALIEKPIDHPIARAFSYETSSTHTLESSRIIPGKGIQAQLSDASGKQYAITLGNLSLMPENCQASFQALQDTSLFTEAKKAIYLCLDGVPTAVALLDEKLRTGVNEVFEYLDTLDLKITLLTGDPNPHWDSIHGVTLESGLSPNEKDKRITELQSQGERLIYIGDGINDAPAMTHCEASIAMGSGAALTQSTATAVLIADSLEALPQAITLCRKIRARVRENLIFAANYNFFGMTLAALGMLHPVVAALLMLGSSIWVSVRALQATR